MPDPSADTPLPPEQDAVRRLLADARHTGPPPPEVVARLDETLAALGRRAGDDARRALAAAASPTSAARRRRVAGIGLLAAAAVVVAGRRARPGPAHRVAATTAPSSSAGARPGHARMAEQQQRPYGRRRTVRRRLGRALLTLAQARDHAAVRGPSRSRPPTRRCPSGWSTCAPRPGASGRAPPTHPRPAPAPSGESEVVASTSRSTVAPEWSCSAVPRATCNASSSTRATTPRRCVRSPSPRPDPPAPPAGRHRGWGRRHPRDGKNAGLRSVETVVRHTRSRHSIHRSH